MADPERTVRAVESDYSERQFRYSLISSSPSIPEVITGFVYNKLDAISTETPLVRTDTRLSTRAKNFDLPLFEERFQNPSELLRLIETSSGWSDSERARLRRLALTIQYYRVHQPSDWFHAREKIPNATKGAYHELHDLLSFILLANANDPQAAYLKCQEMLSRLFVLPQMDFRNLVPVLFEIPVLKNQVRDAPDIIEQAKFLLDKKRLVFLHGTHNIIVIGGQPNSGKSTFAACLYKSMSDILQQCTMEGIIKKDDISVALCDLDLASPTSQFIASEGESIKRQKQKWDSLMAHAAKERLLEIHRTKNIVIADLPGGTPDSITAELTGVATGSILIDKEFPTTGGWKSFLLDSQFPNYLVGAHSRFGDKSRISAIRSYQSRSRGDGVNFLRGRVTDLDRTLKTDLFIEFTAHVLLFDYLPGSVISNIGYRARLHASLGLE